MRVKSFVVGMSEGSVEAMKKLDRFVEQLGTQIVIHSITDTFCSVEFSRCENVSPGLPRIVRVVVYDKPS